jgi:hypothetical protein
MTFTFLVTWELSCYSSLSSTRILYIGLLYSGRLRRLRRVLQVEIIQWSALQTDIIFSSASIAPWATCWSPVLGPQPKPSTWPHDVKDEAIQPAVCLGFLSSRVFISASKRDLPMIASDGQVMVMAVHRATAPILSGSEDKRQQGLPTDVDKVYCESTDS